MAGEHPAAMQHNSAEKQHFVLHAPIMVVVLPVATIALHRAAFAMKFTTATVTIIIATMSSILHEIWTALAQFRKNLFNSILWPPSATLCTAR